MKKYLFIAIAIIALLSSCRSPQYMQVETVRTEIKYEKSKDSLRIVDKVSVRDSVRMRDSVVQVVNDKGEVIRSEIWHWKERYSDTNTLYRELQAKYDSLYSAKQDSVQLPYPVEKKLNRWESMKMELGGWAFGGFVVMALVIAGWLVYRWKKK